MFDRCVHHSRRRYFQTGALLQPLALFLPLLFAALAPSLCWAQGSEDFLSSRTIVADRSLAWVRVGDMNGNGRQDLVTQIHPQWPEPGALVWWENPGSGDLWTSHTISTELEGLFELIDWDGDGALDLAGIAHNPMSYANVLCVLINPGAGEGVWEMQRFNAPKPEGGIYSRTNIKVADIDGDGHLDLVVGNGYMYYYGWPITPWPSPSPMPTPTPWEVEGPGQAAVSGADGVALEGDPITIQSQGYYNYDVFWLRNPGDAATTWTRHLLATGKASGHNIDTWVQLEVADFTGDGKPDIFASWNPSSSVNRSLLFRSQDGFESPISIESSRGHAQFVSGDFTGDGPVNLIYHLTYGLTRQMVLVENADGDGSRWESHNLGNWSFQHLAVADCNGDGRLDLAGGDGQVVAWLENRQGDGRTWVLRRVDESNLRITVGDLDGNGMPDLIGYGYDYRVNGLVWWPNATAPAPSGPGALWLAY